MTDLLHCRYCRGERPFTDKMCLGCGSPRANAMVHILPPNAEVRIPTCPGCGLNHGVKLEEDRYKCPICHAVYERLEQSFLDDRAEFNAMKKERAKKR
jgi:transposase-like protein